MPTGWGRGMGPGPQGELHIKRPEYGQSRGNPVVANIKGMLDKTGLLRLYTLI